MVRNTYTTRDARAAGPGSGRGQQREGGEAGALTKSED